MGAPRFSPGFAKGATLALAWLPALAVLSARLNNEVSNSVTVTVLLLCGLATLGLFVLYPAGGDEPAVRPDRRGELEDRLLEAQRLASDLRAMLDAADEPVLATDGAGTITLANRAAASFFDRPESQLAGLLVEDLFTQADVLALHSAAASGSRHRGQVRILRAGGARVYQVVAAPFPITGPGPEGGPPAAQARHGVVIWLRDVTEHSAAAQLKTDFVANASHELRTPLASIRGAVETLGDAADDPAMVRRLSAMIGSNAARLEELTRDLLDLSRLESAEARVERVPVRLSEVVAPLAEVFGQALARRQLTLRSEISPEVEHAETDPRLLSLILSNLVDNATKFANEGTAVRIVGTLLPPAAGQRPGLRLEVIDQGIGIPLSHQARIFERFYQADPSRSGQAQQRGTGLGLAIVKHAIKNLGGTVRVSSVWKEGTTITVEIPDCVAGAGALGPT